MDIYDEILGEYEGDTTKSPIATILNDIREAEKRNRLSGLQKSSISSW